ncbi:HBL/NHE enterotoxin family protein [Siminovitchia sp. FSL W7-1587]|uniref:non-hemolytic enterotoxin subunit B n=1 Tax=Siminovitchia sp. FSL W7-1587 TaxID=2954699 RepID=UPI0030CE3A9F
MAKKMYKPIMVIVTAGTVAFSMIAPSYASAEAAKQEAVQVSQTDSYKKFQLGPDGLREAIKTTGSNALVMDLYALTIIKQPDINLKNVSVIAIPLQTKIVEDQSNARENAKTWLDQLKPQLIQTNENIINYDNKFEGYYEKLLEAADQKDPAALTARLTRLSDSVMENKQAVDKLIVDLKKFREKLESDTKNLKAHTNEITTILASQETGIPLLKNQIETYYDAINKYNNILIGSAVATAVGPLAIVGGVVVLVTGYGTPLGVGLIAGGIGLTGGGTAGIVLAKKGIDEAEAQIKALTGEVTNAEIQLAGVTAIKQQMQYLTDTIDIAIDSLQNMSTQWNTMGAKYKSLIRNIDVLSPQEFDLLKEDLQIAKASWKNIKGYAENLYVEEIKVVDNQ